MTNLRTWKVALLLLPALLLVACSGRQKQTGTTSKLVSGVAVETVRFASTPRWIPAVGTVQAANISILRAQIGGTVRQMLVKAGDRVHKGEVLALIDNRTQAAQFAAARAQAGAAADSLHEADQRLQAAQANFEFAQAIFKRYQTLLAENSISPQEFDGARAHYAAARADVRALEARRAQAAAGGRQARSQVSLTAAELSYSQILSPMNGVVTAKSVDAGTVVMPGTPLVTVENSSRYQLLASVPERLGGSVTLGQRLAVLLPNGQFEGRVTEIDPAADPSTRTFNIKIDLPENCKCRSGQYGKASVPEGAAESLLVPENAVVDEGELQGLFVIDKENIARFRLIKTGRSAGSQVEVLSGLDPGERVAVSNAGRLANGDRVEAQ